MASNFYPDSNLPIRKTVDLLPEVFKTEANTKFMEAVVDPLVQPGLLEKTVGYIGRRYGKTYNLSDVYLDTDQTLRSRYQLEPGVVVKKDGKIENFYDYLDLKNQLKFFGNFDENDSKITDQEHYSWNPPIDWDKFVNYREYYWVPEFPPSVEIKGQSQRVVSTYKVSLGLTDTYIFSPDGFTNNPTLTLYRGQTYKFQINAPGNGMIIRTAIDTGTLLYNPNLPYSKDQFVIFDDKLWKAKQAIPVTDGSSIDENSQDWEFVDDVYQTSALDYNTGVENNGIVNGTLTFTVPFNAPDVLFYQSAVEPNRFGRFLIDDIDSNTKIDIDKEILGKKSYTSSNGVTFTNGLVVTFSGQVIPEKYSRNNSKWLVEGVGSEITLIDLDLLEISPLEESSPIEILFDNSGFDTEPFDDAATYPAAKDYITINRSSRDRNAWSRYNRWFHRSVLDFAHSFSESSFEALETSRAKRPIIEFKPNIQLFNHGSSAKLAVDFIDNFTSDIFSTIEGSSGYIIDGEFLFNGARLLVTADTDSTANNRIYVVNFIKHNSNNLQISLTRADDHEPISGESVLVKRGKNSKGLMYYFDGTSWKASQKKTRTQQPPKFDVFDSDGVSFGDPETYPVSTFSGSEIVSYKLGSGPIDTELGFSLSYLNIDNVGDILFDYDFDSDEFIYKIDTQILTKKVDTGFYKTTDDQAYYNGWKLLDPDYAQPILETIAVDKDTNQIISSAIDWKNTSTTEIKKILIYKNGLLFKGSYSRNENTFVFEDQFKENDVVVLKVFTDAVPDQGYYEIPLGLEKNPLNTEIESFTLGQASDHVSTGLDLINDFVGIYPGSSNLRDLDDYQNLCKRFLKHSAPSPVAAALICDKSINIIKSIQQAKKSYTDFKNNFVDLAYKLYYDQQPLDFVDVILDEIGRTKNPQSPYAGSDMVGNGAFSELRYEVEDEGIKTFALSEKFDLDTLSSRAVYVYINNQQLLHGSDYVFNSTFGFVRLTVSLVEGDVIIIREYVSTAINFIPATPTKLGLYKKYKPMKFLDDTYVEPKEVIQGHDGSITVAYGDFRDDVLLELETRIYNNIKQHYDESVFDIDKILGGYYKTGLYNKKDLDNIVSVDFLKWIADTNIDYVNNVFFDSQDSFTYTYSNMTNREGTQNLPGYWRGVYSWFYDTDRPHRCPWEMLGFSEKPTWWEDEYGPAPYTSNNLILWEDLRDGIVRQGSRTGTYDRYKRPTLTNHIPVDGDGNLLSPVDSGLASNFSLINNQGDFNLGDVSPVEYAWRSSSEWPFAVCSALCMLKPFEFITDNFNRSMITTNKINQTIHKSTGVFTKIEDLKYDPIIDSVSGLCVYVADYLKTQTAPLTLISDKISNIDVNLTSRISGFVDAAQQKYILDSKNPKSSTSSIFIPQENYDIYFNQSSPFNTISYSGIVIEKIEGRGWKLGGYDSLYPYFNYYEAVASQSDPLISVGGISENFLEWNSEKFYGNGVLVRYSGSYYRSLKSHTAAASFDSNLWKKLPGLPLKNAVEAFNRRNFNRLRLKKLNYGTIFSNLQAVVDFLLGYQEYLKSIGFVFDRYDPELKVAQDWTTAAKEFMFWSKHNWSGGSLLTLSPSAQSVVLNLQLGVADNLLDSFYDYQVLKNDGTPLKPQFINVSRTFKNITITTTNTNDGIYFIKINLILKEHVVIFNDRTVFNDVLYDKPTGYRQERIKARGFRTVDWDGDYTSPGFLFDNVDIQIWQPFTDYNLGDIVAYKSYNWTSLTNQLGSAEFIDANWTKLDSSPTKSLIANFDYRINQFEDYYEVDTPGVGSSQRDLARHAVGYQQREYLQNLVEDEVSQFRLYQGFIRDKGTNNSIVKIFDKLSRTADDSVVLKEEWAFKVGELGGIDQTAEIEFRVKKDDLALNPQPVLLSTQARSQINQDQYLRIYSDDYTISPNSFDFAINPTKYYDKITRSAGYTNLNQVDIILKTRDDLLSLKIDDIKENYHLWITFDNNDWSVLRYNESTALKIVAVSLDDNGVRLQLNRVHNLLAGEIIGITEIENLTGFFKILSVTSSTILVASDATTAPAIQDSTAASIGIFTPSRFRNYSDLDLQATAILKQNSKIWIDDAGDSHWKVLEKIKQYRDYEIEDYGITTPLHAGTSVLYIDTLKQMISSIPGSGYVMSHSDKIAAGSTVLGLKQIIPPPTGFESAVSGVFGEVLSVSPDYRWLAIASPRASSVPNNFMGELTRRSYLAGEVVMFNGKMWKALTNIPLLDDGSSINFSSQDWQPATIIEANTSARGAGYYEQGMITLYRYFEQQWEPAYSFVSPRPDANEKFGSTVSIGVSGSKYYMAVGATGSLGNKGRVYIYYYDGTAWSHLENTKYSGLYNPGAVFQGSFSSDTLTVSSITAGRITLGMPISGTGIPPGTTITRFISGTREGVGLYQVDFDVTSPPVIISSTTIIGTQIYPKGSIVWAEGDLYEALYDNQGDGSTLSILSNEWIKLDPVATQCSLPVSAAIDDDGSTLSSGILTADHLAEIVKEGDQFGSSMTMNRDGSILVIGTPIGDDEYFENYKGNWREYEDYSTGDVVKYQGTYHRLTDIDPDPDSVTVSKGQRPDDGLPWINVGDSTYKITGKIFIYQRTGQIYQLKQTITSQNLSDLNDIGTEEIITEGDKFGYSVDIDLSGTVLVISAPMADINLQTNGAVYVFEKSSSGFEFRLKQKLQSYEPYTNEFFGSSVSISGSTERIAIGAKNSAYRLITRFSSGTTFDKNKTQFFESQGYPGQVYVYERKGDRYFLAEKLDPDLANNESFGHSVDCTGSAIAVGSPNYEVDDVRIGIARLFRKIDGVDSLKTISDESKLIDIDKIKNIELYDTQNNIKLGDIDIVDGYKMKILGVADQEIKFKTVYDPATYIIGTDDQTVDDHTAWFEKYVGQVWWDLSKVKFINYEQSDIAYRIGNWNVQAEGSSIDVYEWIESVLLPSEWSLLADTVEGLAQGISGQPKYPDDSVLSYKIFTNPTTGLEVGTKYYYWVKNKTTIPATNNRKLSIATIRDYIDNPIGTGNPFVGVIDVDKFLFFNFNGIITTDSVLFNIEFKSDDKALNHYHREYQLLTEEVADSVPTASIERKWIDSLAGYDEAGNAVPDPKLAPKQRYGLKFRPRQSMFVDSAKALKIAITNINEILKIRPFADLIDFEYLNLKDEIPGVGLNQYDLEVDSLIDLEQVGTAKIKQAELRANIIDGEVDTIDIIDPGFGYRVAPYIVIDGDGVGAKANITIDGQGRVVTATVTIKGRKYISAVVKIRAFSVLVSNDNSLNNFWSIYSWDDIRKGFYRSKSQGFDTTRYWEYTDWWQEGYGPSQRIVKEIEGLYEEPTVSIQPGDLLRIKEYANGGWAVIEKVEDGQGTLLGNYNLVGRQSGTIAIKDILYSAISGGIGYDNNVAYDANLFDLQPVKELRIIFQAVKENIFVDDLRVEWNKLFFSSVRYALSEQQYVDWTFKTSFLNATHNVGDLDQRPTYKNDNLDSFRQYIEEVKPYRTSIREYTSRYTEIEPVAAATTDFDLPPAYSARDGKILPVSPAYNRFDEYPWKSWFDNNGCSIIEITISDGGENYTSAPTVIIDGNGTSASAQAFISNGAVSGIRVSNAGQGYTKIPTVSLVGGNGSSNRTAKAAAVMGNSKTRSFNLGIKFDRIEKIGIYSTFTNSQTFTATGNTAVFELDFAPSIDKSKISITKNSQIVIPNEYQINLYRSSIDTYKLIKGKIRFLTAPKAGDVIVVNYEKNDELLDSVSRIQRYYAPTAGMKGNELNQLMTGVDYGGVQIQGTTFDVTGGWDALPWFTDNWDSIEPNSDFYYVVNGRIYREYNLDSTSYINYQAGEVVELNGIFYRAIEANFNKDPIEFVDIWEELTISLPYVPESGQPISVYIKRSNETRATRVDDPYFNVYDGSTVQPNGRVSAPATAILNTFIGDGVSNSIPIQNYTTLFEGDTIIVRKLDSDGSVTITDVNLLDTRISGGSLSNIHGAYVTATGLTPEEIVIDGDKFVAPDQVPAPEENVPGQVLDSLSIKVWNVTSPGAAPLQNKVIISDGVTKEYDIGLTIAESSSVLVYVDKIRQGASLADSSIDYTINYANNTIEFLTAPEFASIIEIISVGTGGITLLDYQEFTADGDTTLFLTKAVYDQVTDILVTVDGEVFVTGLVNSSEFIDTKNRAMAQFGIAPEDGSVVKIICFGSSVVSDSTGLPFIRINRQTVIYDGSTRNIDLDRFIDLGRSSPLSSMIVEVNGEVLESVDTHYAVYDGTNNQIVIATDPNQPFGVVTSGFIKVYINNVLQRFVIDYTFDGNTNIVSISSSRLTIGDVIKIENNYAVKYSIDNNNLVLDPSLVLSINDVIEITWFSEYPTMDMITDEYTGGKVNYLLSRTPLDINYIWIYKNGTRLTRGLDYTLSLPRSVVYLTEETTELDRIRIVQFSNIVYQQPKAFEIFKDMLNNYHYKRYSRNNKITLVKDLYYYDTTIEVSDSSLLTDPIPSRNIPGVISVNNERIEYMQKIGNVLSQLRRGSLGTGIAELHVSGSYLVDVGAADTLPYVETQETIDFFSDGSSLIIGPLEFVPSKSIRTSWYRETIPSTHGPCDEIEVFVAGRRLRKNPIDVWNNSISASSPYGDEQQEAEFSVDGGTAAVRLTQTVPAGTKIVIIRRQGRIWYERGLATASRGVSLLSNETPIAQFIAKKGSELPE
jgi:hypothetical protein